MLIAISMLTVAVSAYIVGYQVGQYTLVKKINKVKSTLLESIERWKSTAKLYSQYPGASPKAMGYINQAQEITTKINELTAQAEMPSKSASHSSWKNDIKREAMKLDQQRLQLLKKAVDEGYDPKVTHEGKTGKLSEFVAEQLNRYSTPVAEKPSLRLIKKPHLTVVK